MTKQQSLPFDGSNKPKKLTNLNYEDIEQYDEVLDEYLQHCLDVYWQRVEDGSWPWPYDTGEDSDDELETITY